MIKEQVLFKMIPLSEEKFFRKACLTWSLNIILTLWLSIIQYAF